MKDLFPFWTPVIVSLLLTPFMLLVGIGSGGAGHGNYFWAKLLFPFTLASTGYFQVITWPFVLLAVVQFSLYGLVLGATRLKGRMYLGLLTIALIHALAIAVCLAFVSDGFA